MKGPHRVNKPNSVGPRGFPARYLFTQQQVMLCALDTSVTKEKSYFSVPFHGEEIAIMDAF